MSTTTNSSQSPSGIRAPKANNAAPPFERFLDLFKDGRKKWWVVIPCLVVLAAIGAAAYYQLAYLPAHKSSIAAAPQTSVARRGDILLAR